MLYRVLAWTRLIKIWGSLRFDDMQKIKPSELHLTQGRLTTTLRSSKTSGPGKRVQELPVCVSEHAHVWAAEWIGVGLELLRTHADFDRDYLLPQFNFDWSGFKKKCATYNDVCSYSCALRKTLPRQSDWERLVPEDLASFWTEHSERATLPTGLSMLGVGTSDRNLVGRWKPDASDNYVRSYNGLVSKFQLKFAKVLRKGDRTKLLDEVDILESAGAWLQARRSDIPEDERGYIVQHLEDSLAFYHDMGLDRNLLEAAEVSYDDDTTLAEILGQQPDEEIVEKVDRSSVNFVVVHINRRCKRLHKVVGGCWMARDRKFKSSKEFIERPSDDEFTHVCRVCWPNSKGEDESTEDTSSTSTSSDSDDDDIA